MPPPHVGTIVSIFIFASFGATRFSPLALLARTPYHAKHVPLPDSSPRVRAATWLKPAGTRVGKRLRFTPSWRVWLNPIDLNLDAQWWIALAQRLHIEDKVEQFFHDATTPHNVLDRVAEVGWRHAVYPVCPGAPLDPHRVAPAGP